MTRRDIAINHIRRELRKAVFSPSFASEETQQALAESVYRYAGRTVMEAWQADMREVEQAQ